MSIECDVLVIGSGPAGSSVARATAKKGLKTILIEEDKEIGRPVQCAEGIGSYLIPFMPFEIPKEQLIWKIEGMYFWANDVAFIKKGGIWSGYTIERSKWDKWLASLATNIGTTLLTNTKLTSLDYDNNYRVKKATAIQNGKKIEFKPKIVVAADGIDSTVLDILKVKKKKGCIGHVKSYEMKNLELKYPKYDQLFFGDFAPRAYAYIFPISNTRANLGVGTIYDDRNLDEYFENFIDIPCIKKQVTKGEKVIEKTGDAPVRNISDKLLYGNIFIAGDAANQNIKPFIEGNIPGIICGDILGNLIYNVLKNDEKAENYENIINEKFDLIKNSQGYTDIVYGESEIESKTFNIFLLGLMSEIIELNEKNVETFCTKGYDFIKKYVMERGAFIEK